MTWNGGKASKKRERPGIADDQSAPDDTLSLRSLSPIYNKEQHGVYVQILKAELSKQASDAPRNIALTGHYGSGKSSVLAEVQRVLIDDGVKVINLSLPSLGIGEGRIPQDGDAARDKTNLIQKEIVKLLLYRRKPSDMPASRYNRLDTFDHRRAIPAAVVVAVGATGLAFLLRLPTHVQEALPPQGWAWIDAHSWGNWAGPIQWLSLLVIFVLGGLAAVWAQRLLQQRLRVTELSAGPTKVALSDAASSYFDEFLDEIVYFFQTSRTTVVIFEDLDRFKNPYIFETLRELNLLLNNAEQTGVTPIRFVYAIRDSIFEQLDAATEEAGDPATDATGAVDASGLANAAAAAKRSETHRLTSTNRPKFFDLVVPMVPFISHRTSRELIRKELRSLPEAARPGHAVVDIVSAHLTDMRLIKNICNEYDVFRHYILVEGGLQELGADRLFASIVYKNLYLADYEKITDGTSRLDTMYAVYRRWVAQQIARTREAERRARTRLRRIDAIDDRAAGLGARLGEVLRALYGFQPDQVQVAGTRYQGSTLSGTDFWRDYLSDRGDLTVFRSPHQAAGALPFAKIETFMGYSLADEEWAEEAKAEVIAEIERAEDDQRTLQHASIKEAIDEIDLRVEYEGESRSLVSIADDLFEGADLVLELLGSGLLDENFTLYVTQFPGQAISASAMNFIIKAVQPNVPDMDFHFGVNVEVDASPILELLNAESVRLLAGDSIFNIELFDYLLEHDTEKLNEPIERLAAAAESDRTFIDAYLVSGAQPNELIRRLSASWGGVFRYLLAREEGSMDDELFDAAFGGVQSELTYSLSAEERPMVEEVLAHLPALASHQPTERAVAIATALRRMGLRVADLGHVAQPLRNEIAKRSLYPVTLGNLRAVVGSDDMLPLDAIRRARKDDVYKYALGHLRTYLTAIALADGVPTIANADFYGEILQDVGIADADALEEVAKKAAPACMLSDLDKVDAPLWPAVAAARRLTLTAHNVAAYVAEHDVDLDLGRWLAAAGTIVVEADDSTPLGPLALRLLNAVSLRDEAKVSLVESLGLAAGALDPANLEREAHAVLPDLVRGGVVADDAAAYAILDDDEWSIKQTLIAVSEEFPRYMTSIDLSAGDLFKIASTSVPEPVKEALLKDVKAFEDRLDSRAATAIARWATTKGDAPSDEALVTLATQGGPTSALPVLELLGAQAESIDLDVLKQALDGLQTPYRQLTAPGHDRPKILASSGVEPILARLQKANIVSKFELKQKKGTYEVSKRYK